MLLDSHDTTPAGNVSVGSEDDTVIGDILLHLEKDLPERIKPRLAPVKIEERFNEQALLDSGATTDVISTTLCEELQLADKIKRYNNPKKAKTADGYVNVIGHIKLNIKVNLTKSNIVEARNFYVIDTAHRLIILGLSFMKAHVDVLTITDLLSADMSNYELLGQPIEVKYVDYNERYVSKLINNNENIFYLAYLYELENFNDREEKVIDLKITDNKVNQMRARILHDYESTVTEEPPMKLPPKERIKHRIHLIESNKISFRNQYKLIRKRRINETKINY